MAVPTGVEFTTLAKGKAVKKVHCESCGNDYVYLMKRGFEGLETAWLSSTEKKAKDMSKMKAVLGLQMMLDADCELIPCPECGWYQPNMVKKIRQGFRDNFATAGLIMIAVAVVLVLGAFAHFGEQVPGADQLQLRHPVLLAFAVPLAALGIALYPLGKVLASRKDPNEDDPERRKKLGRRSSISRSEYEENTMGKPVEVIRLAGFDPPGEPELRRMGTGSYWLVFKQMPPTWVRTGFDAALERLELKMAFKRQLEEAIAVPVVSVDEESFSIESPPQNCVEKVKRFLSEFRRNHESKKSKE
jgi:hypothetical protein